MLPVISFIAISIGIRSGRYSAQVNSSLPFMSIYSSIFFTLYETLKSNKNPFHTFISGWAITAFSTILTQPIFNVQKRMIRNSQGRDTFYYTSPTYPKMERFFKISNLRVDGMKNRVWNSYICNWKTGPKKVF